MKHVSASLAIFAAVSALMFVKPQVFQSAFTIIAFAAVGLALLIFGFLGWLMVAPESAKATGIAVTVTPSCFVGSEGSGSWLRIVDELSRPLRVEWAGADYFIIIVVTAVFGPGMIGLFVLHPRSFDPNLPIAVIIGVCIMVLVACVACVSLAYTYFRARPAMLVDVAAISLLRGAKIVQSVPRDTIRGLRIDTIAYLSGHDRATPNYILVAKLDGGTEQRLCISDREAQITQIANAICSRMSFGPDVAIERSEAGGVAAGGSGERQRRDLPHALPAPLLDRARQLKAQGKLVALVILLRNSTGMTLAEAKRSIDRL